MNEGANNGPEVASERADNSQERKPPSYADIVRMQEEEALRRQSKKSKKGGKKKIEKHLTLKETMAEEAKRKREHPAGYMRTGLPPGTSTVGEGSRGPKPEED